MYGTIHMGQIGKISIESFGSMPLVVLMLVGM